jgi:hypothetical protein
MIALDPRHIIIEGPTQYCGGSDSHGVTTSLPAFLSSKPALAWDLAEVIGTAPTPDSSDVEVHLEELERLLAITELSVYALCVTSH